MRLNLTDSLSRCSVILYMFLILICKIYSKKAYAHQMIDICTIHYICISQIDKDSCQKQLFIFHELSAFKNNSQLYIIWFRRRHIQY